MPSLRYIRIGLYTSFEVSPVKSQSLSRRDSGRFRMVDCGLCRLGERETD